MGRQFLGGDGGDWWEKVVNSGYVSKVGQTKVP